MKRLAALLCATSALALAQPASAAIAIVASSFTTANGSAAANTQAAPASTVDVPIGSLSVVLCGTRSADTQTVPTDVAGNTYVNTGALIAATNGSQNFNIYYVITTADKPIGDITTCHYSSAAANHKYISIAAFSGIAATSLFDARATGTGTTGSPSVATGTLNYSGKAQVLVIAALTVNATPTATPNGTWVDLGFGGSSLDMQYNIVNSGTTTTTFGPTLSPASAGWDLGMPDFRGSAAAASGSPPAMSHSSLTGAGQ